MTAEKFDVYSHVTNQIIAQIEAGTPPWRRPLPPLPSTTATAGRTQTLAATACTLPPAPAG